MHQVEQSALPWSEVDQSAALRRYSALDAPPDPAFDDIVRLAAQACAAPAAFVGFVAGDRLRLRASVGLPSQADVALPPREPSLLAAGGTVIVDVEADPAARDHPLFRGPPAWRFHAGVPLVTPEGSPIGLLGVLAPEPRAAGLDAAQAVALQALARQAMALIELGRAGAARDRSEEWLTLALDASGAIGTWSWDPAADLVFADAVFADLFALPSATAAQGVATRDVLAAIHPGDRHRVRVALYAAAASAGDFAEECRVVRPDDTVRWVLARGRCFHEAGRAARYPGVVVDISERKRQTERLRMSEMAARLALEAGRIGTFVYVPDTGSLTWDVRCKELFGLPPEAAVDYATFLAGLHPDDRATVDAAVAATLDPAGNGEYDVEYRTIGLADGGVERWIAAKGRAFRAADDVVHFVGTVRDITQRRASEEALKTAEANVRVALAAAQLGRWDHDPSTGRRFWDERCCEIFGVGETAQMSFEALLAAVHPEDRQRVVAAVRDATDPAGDAHLRVQYRIRRFSDGEERWIAASGAALFTDGVCTRFLGVVADITQTKRNEEYLHLLVNELNHRVKNSFALVQALASQSFRDADVPAEPLQAFSGRLVALSRAHDALTGQNWEGADLREVLAPTVAAHGGGADRFDISGPRVRLSAKLALSVSMALHELSTNALKYGALSNEAGRVRVSWHVDAAASPPRLRLRWQEEGGPPVVAPRRRGFGSRLLERGLAAELGGEVVVAYEPAGVVCTMSVPLVETRVEAE